ncbi:hypothetical protein VD0002_g5709 [Verticillium dahliae]|nr:hypothetical protein VD0003_g4384 [Verticillium dahliae]PNH62309.1 hypothetical protein VD0002_g5709 [Verticillium dahliae]
MSTVFTLARTAGSEQLNKAAPFRRREETCMRGILAARRSANCRACLRAREASSDGVPTAAAPSAVLDLRSSFDKVETPASQACARAYARTEGASAG